MISDMPVVSIIMNCYNGEKYLLQSLNSIINQTYQNWELIFWDNQSTDSSRKKGNSLNDRRIKYFRSQIKLSLGEARNFALEKCLGDFVCFLDVDDYWEPSKLEDQLKWYRENPDYSFLYTNFNIIYTKKIAKNILKGYQPQGYVFREFLEQYPVNLQTVMIRRECFISAKYLFDPRLNLAEEYDLFLRIIINSKVGYLNKSYANYRVHSQMNSIISVEMWPEEIEYIINKFKIEIFDFENKYRISINKLYSKISYYRARGKMNSGSFSEARKILLPHILSSYKISILYIITYFGKKAWIFTHRVSGKII